MDWRERDTFGLASATDQQSSAQTNKQLVAEPKYRSRDTATTSTEATDDKAEHVVTRIAWSADFQGTFYLQNADGSGGRVGITHYFGANSGDERSVHLPMGKGNPIKYTSTGTGNLSLMVTYYTKRYTSRKPT